MPDIVWRSEGLVRYIELRSRYIENACKYTHIWFNFTGKL